MKKLFSILFMLLPVAGFSSVYNCSGSGFIIDIAGNPLEMKVNGNGFNTMAQNVRASSTFDTVVTGNTLNPAASLRLTIKDSSFGNPGDNFKATFQVSSAAGIKEFTNLICIRGND